MSSVSLRHGAVAALAVGTLLTFASGANAEPRATRIFCAEGRNADGTCVNPAAAQAARLTGCVATQSQLSVSAGPACAPVGIDRDYRYPNSVFADGYRRPGSSAYRFTGPSTSYTTTY